MGTDISPDLWRECVYSVYEQRRHNRNAGRHVEEDTVNNKKPRVVMMRGFFFLVLLVHNHGRCFVVVTNYVEYLICFITIQTRQRGGNEFVALAHLELIER